MMLRHCAGIVVCVLGLGAIVLASSSQRVDADVPDFVLSAWQDGRPVKQISWSLHFGKPTVRLDLRQELNFGASVQAADVSDDLTLFARVLERGKVISPVHSVDSEPPAAGSRNSFPRGFVVLGMTAIVRPGKYQLQMALVDRASGRYSTRIEDVTIGGSETQPLERAFQTFGKFESVPRIDPEKRTLPPSFVRSIWDARERMAELLRGRIRPELTVPVELTVFDQGFSADRPTFLVDRPSNVSVIARLDPPGRAIGSDRLLALFEYNLSNLLTVLTRLDVSRGTARLTGLDLTAQTRTLDRVDMKGITAEMLGNAIRKDRSTVSVGQLSNAADGGRLLREVLQERLDEAAADNSGASHTIIVVSARSAFKNSANLAMTRDCRCKVYYIRFALMPNERDDIDNMLKAYEPRVFEPVNWAQFREQFSNIYGQLIQ